MARPQKWQRGVTLVELMVAMVLGMLVSAGIITVFVSTSNSNKAQMQLARLQEEGRFAINRLGGDLRMANGLYCANTGGVAESGASGLYLDHLLVPKVYAKNLIDGVGPISGAFGDMTTTWGASNGSGSSYPARPVTPYSMPSFLFMRGYDCTLATCLPVDPSTAGLPLMGSKVGDRVKGSDVITVRYINPSSGWAMGGVGGSTVATGATSGTITSITLNPLPGEPSRSNFSNGDLVMVADCSSAQIFAASYSATTGKLILPGADNFSDSQPVSPSLQSAPKIFDVNRDLQTTTYYLKVVSANNDGQPPLTGALMRRVNGGLKADNTGIQSGAADEEMVRGIERLDFKYGVEDYGGNTSFLAAKDVDASTQCPPAEQDAITTTGCLWRGVKSIEVSILMDGQIPLYSLSDGDMSYAYDVDNVLKPAIPDAHAIRPKDQGFINQMLRREFTALIAVRNYNP